MNPIAFCDLEIANAQHLLQTGHEDIKGLQLAIHDWEREKQLISLELCDDSEQRLREYRKFIDTKQRLTPDAGIADVALPSQLFPFQQDIVRWALRRGKAAIFADCGLGKTPMQLSWAACIAKHTQKPVLIFAPCAVAAQTQREGRKFNLPVEIWQIESDSATSTSGVTNYEKLHHFKDPSRYGGLVLDESSILKGFDGKTRRALTEFAATMPFRLACTATPAPNDLMEIVNHAEFLGIMTAKEIFAMYFKNDGNDTHKWRLKHHAKSDFWEWLASWSVALRKPSDLGYEDSTFKLPALSIEQLTVPSLLNPQDVKTLQRTWRFGQKRSVNVYIVTSEAEGVVVENIKRKEAESSQMMDQIVKRTSVYTTAQCKREDAVYEEDLQYSSNWAMWLGDSIMQMDAIETESVGLTVFSPPFPSMYVYTNSPADIGNVRTIDELIEHFRFLTKPLLRVTQPGRSCCIHLTQAVAFKGVDGYIGIKDFRGRIIQTMEESGWIYYGEVCIDKNPQVKAIRTKDAGLLFKSLATDSSRMHMALADYILQFRKHGESPEPIRAGISERYRNSNGWISSEEWIEWAAPVWYRKPTEYVSAAKWKTWAQKNLDEKRHKEFSDMVAAAGLPKIGGIKETDTLSVRAARDKEDERHLCPLQLGVIERCIKLWSNPGDLVFDPFAGIGSVGVKALELNRTFYGIELKRSYFDVACQYLRRAEQTTT